MKDIESLFMAVRQKAMNTQIPYASDELLELLGMIDGYKNPELYYLGSRIVGRMSTVLKDYVYVEGDNHKKGLFVERSEEEGKVLDLFDFSIDPFEFIAHYATYHRQDKFAGKMGKVPLGIRNDELRELPLKLSYALKTKPDNSGN